MSQGRAIPKAGNPSRHLPPHLNCCAPLPHHNQGQMLSQDINARIFNPKEELMPVSLPGSKAGLLGWAGRG